MVHSKTVSRSGIDISATIPDFLLKAPKISGCSTMAATGDRSRMRPLQYRRAPRDSKLHYSQKIFVFEERLCNIGASSAAEIHLKLTIKVEY